MVRPGWQREKRRLQREPPESREQRAGTSEDPERETPGQAGKVQATRQILHQVPLSTPVSLVSLLPAYRQLSPAGR